MLLRRRNRWQRWDDEHRWDDLARYNTEVARGIVHTPEWDARMAEEQERFNESMRPGLSRDALDDDTGNNTY